MRTALRLGIDATCLASRRGYGRFLRELLPPLLDAGASHDWVLFIDRESAAQVEPFAVRTVEPVTSRSQAAAASGRGNRSLRDLWTMGRAVAREGRDGMFFPSVYSYFPVPRAVATVVAFHDAIPERHGNLVFPTARNRWLWKAKVTLARRQARALLTVSDWSRRALAEHFRLPPERIFVAPEAPSAVFEPVTDPAPCWAWLRKHGLPEDARYLIYVGGFNPHKNLETLVAALASVVGRDAGCDLHLLLVGDHEGDVFHADVPALRRRIAASDLAGRVHLTGFVPDDELRHLYAGAVCLVLPSLEEGFGLPAVEAAACGTPCIATRNSPLPELLEGGGIFVDPTDRAALERALEALLGSRALRERLGTVARARAASLSWQRTAQCTLEAIEVACRGST